MARLAKLVLLLAIAGLPCFGQHADYTMTSAATADDLPNSYIHSFTQTADGFIWFGTRDGLARFDGRALKVIGRTADPVLEASINCITMAVDKVDGSLWIGTSRGVVHKMGNLFKRIGDASGLPPNHVWAVAAARGGGVWAGTGFGMARIYPDGKVERFFKDIYFNSSKNSKEVTSLLEDDTGRLWIGSADEMFQGNLERKVLERSKAAPKYRQRTASLMQARDGWVYWTTSSGLARQREQVFEFFACKEEVLGVAEGPDGSIWTGGRRLRHLEKGELIPVKPEIFKEEEASALFFDSQGTLWVGTRKGAGVLKFTFSPFQVYDERDGITKREVLSVMPGRAADTLWVGTGSGVFQMTNGALHKVVVTNFSGSRRVEELVNDEVSLFFEEENGAICAKARDFSGICLEGGAASFATRFQVCCAPNSWLKDNAGRIWSAHSGFVARQEGDALHLLTSSRGYETWRGQINPKVLVGRSLHWHTNMPHSSHFAGLLRTADGTIWAGSGHGCLYAFQDDGMNIFGKAEGFDAQALVPLLQDGTGALWVSSEKGLYRKEGAKVGLVSFEPALNVTPIGALLEDDAGFIWASAASGLFRFDARNLATTALGRSSRCPAVRLPVHCNGGTFPSAVKTGDGRLWFPAREGLIRVDPKDLLKIPFDFPAIIDAAVLDGREFKIERGAAGAGRQKFPPGSGRILQFSFTRAALQGLYQAAFRYRLRGRGESWTETLRERTVTYIDLSPGDYDFEVSSQNVDGRWQPPASFRFNLQSYFRQTREFYGLLAALLFGTGLALHQWRFQMYRRFKLLKAREALLEERQRIARDMHDTLGAALTSIKLLSDIATRKTAPEQPGSAELDRIRQQATKAARELDETVWLLNNEECSVADLLNHIVSYAEEFLEAAGVRLFATVPTALSSANVSSQTRRHIMLAVGEALTNITRHAAATHVKLDIHIDAGRLHIQIADDGVGFALAATANGNGLSNMRVRMEALNGLFARQPNAPRGTIVVFKIPLKSLINKEAAHD